MARRLDADPDGPYLDVCGTSLTAAQVQRAAASLARALVEMGVAPGDRVATLIENSPEATLAWWGAITAGAVAVPVNTAYKGSYLRHQLADSGAKVLVVADALAERAARVLGELPRAGPRGRRPRRRARRQPRGRRGGWRRRAPGRGRGPDRAHLGRGAGRRSGGAERRHPPRRPGHLHLHGGYHGSVEGLHAQPPLSRGPGQPDRHLLEAHGRRRGVDPVAAVPLQRHLHRGGRAAGVGWSGRHLRALLGVQLLAGDEPGGRHHHLHARDHGLPVGPRRRPSRDAPIRRTRGQHQPAVVGGGAHAGGGRVGHQGAVRAHHVQRGLRRDRGQPGLVATARRRQPPQCGGRDQRRVLRRAHLRRRRPRAGARRRRARSCCGPSVPT